jgi:Cu/Ag efflux protein CusF
MTIMKSVCAAAAGLALVSSAAWADQGTITQIDRTTNTIAIQQPLSGTVGANGASAPSRPYKVQSPGALENLHAGDQVTFSVNQNGGVDTITKIEKKK